MSTTARCSVPGSTCRMLQLELPDPRPVWAALDAAGARRFTGRLTLHLEPVVRVWFTAGEAYLAEREGDAPLAERLVALGVVSAEDVAVGTVRIGEVAHLGRLFDRVPSVDRDAVELAVELQTAELLGEVADHVVGHVELGHHQHHPSGIDRWWRRPAVDARTVLPAPAASSTLDEATALAARVAEQARALPTWTATAPAMTGAATAVHVTLPEPAAHTEVVEPPTAIVLDDAPSPGAEQLTAAIHLVIEDDVDDHGDDDDDAGLIPDELRASIRAALAEIEAATRPLVTDGLTIATFLADLAGDDEQSADRTSDEDAGDLVPAFHLDHAELPHLRLSAG